MENKPNSALQILNKIDRDGLNDDELAEWTLDRSGVDVASDSVLRIAYDHYSRRPDACGSSGRRKKSWGFARYMKGNP